MKSYHIGSKVYAFQAGEEVILEDGFDSGNNFIAEIVPCQPDYSVINPKPEPGEFITEHFKNNQFKNNPNNIESNVNIKAYPTIEVDDRITLEIIGLEKVNCVLVNVQGKIITQKNYNGNVNGFTEYLSVSNISAGIYFLIIRSSNKSETIKIIKQ